MSTFRIKMARQAGEQKAKQSGFEKFPILVKDIVAKEKIQLVAKPPDKKGVSGGIIFDGDDVTIFYATNIKSNGFRNFTIGHELGHYFLPGHPEEILTSGPIHVSRAGFTQGSSSIEIEADHFSAGLLMPSNLVRGELNSTQIGLEGILRLSGEAQCSLTASAIRAAECSEYPMAIIVSQNNQICYGFLSESFKALRPNQFPRNGMPLPHTSTRQFNQNFENVTSANRKCGSTELSEWFGSNTNIQLDEEIIGLGYYGYTLTVLSSEDLVLYPLDEDDEEEKLTDSWSPKFAYGR